MSLPGWTAALTYSQNDPALLVELAGMQSALPISVCGRVKRHNTLSGQMGPREAAALPGGGSSSGGTSVTSGGSCAVGGLHGGPARGKRTC